MKIPPLIKKRNTLNFTISYQEDISKNNYYFVDECKGCLFHKPLHASSRDAGGEQCMLFGVVLDCSPVIKRYKQCLEAEKFSTAEADNKPKEVL